MSPANVVRPAPTTSANRLTDKLGKSGQRLARFGVVGLSGVVVNTAVLALLVQLGHLEPPLAGALATEAAAISNFTLHDRWTFRDRSGASGWIGRALRYNLSVLGGMAITVGVLTALTNGLHLQYLIANVGAIGAGFLCNYTLSSRFAWTTEVSRRWD